MIEPARRWKPPEAAETPASAASLTVRTSSAQTETTDGAGFLLSGPALWAHWNALRGDAYHLDDRERFVQRLTAHPTCDPTGLVVYSGRGIRYFGPVQVNEHFVPRLERFEAIVSTVAEEIYGRPPRRIHHYGAYACRTSRTRSRRLSEHALGNAIDITGFDFGPAQKDRSFSAELPKPLKHPFQIRVARHWEPRDGAANQIHARFLRVLLERLLEANAFRGVIGPGHRGHADHFHFDMSPWHFVRN